MMGKEAISNDIDLVVRAKLRADEAHEGQTRRGNGEPYAMHPTRVAAVVAEYVSAEAVAAAFLHDVLEDTDSKIDDFPDYTRKLVDILTKRTDEERDEYLKRVSDSACPEAILIKIADRTDNLVDGKKLGKGWVKGYLKGAHKILDAARANGLADHALVFNLCATVEDIQKWAYSKDVT
jgi:(p)ppGpp synthase/HD superfamily hydrolase